MWISRRRYEELEDRIKKLESLTNDLKRYDLVRMNSILSRITRLLDKGKSGEITYTCNEGQLYVSPANEYIRENAYTYIYSDFKEYKISGLYLYKPEFIPDETNKDVIRVKDRTKIDNDIKNYQYVIDLKNKSYVQTA